MKTILTQLKYRATMSIGVLSVIACNKNLEGLSMKTNVLEPEETKQTCEEKLKSDFLESAKQGKLEIVKSLIDQPNVDKEAKTDRGRTALHLAAENGHLEVVSYLVGKSCNKNATDSYGLTALHLASAYGHLNVVRYLVEKAKLKVNLLNNYGGSPIHEAVAAGSLQVVQYFVETHGLKDARGQQNTGMPLHVAALCDKLPILIYLLDKGANKNAEDDSLRTPLHISAEFGRLDLVKHLVEHANAKVDPLDVDKKMPIDLADENKHQDVVDYLLNKLPLLMFKSSTQKPKLQQQIDIVLNDNNFKQNYNKLLEQLGIKPNAIDQSDFPKHVMNNMERIINGEKPYVNHNLENDPAFKSKVDECLDGIRKELQNQALNATAEVKARIEAFSVESLRPYLIPLVKAIEEKLARDKKFEALRKENDKKIEEHRVENEKKLDKQVEKVNAYTDKFIKEMKSEEASKKEGRHRIGCGLWSKKEAKPCLNSFIPESRTYDMEEIKEDIQYLEEDLEALFQYKWENLEALFQNKTLNAKNKHVINSKEERISTFHELPFYNDPWAKEIKKVNTEAKRTFNKILKQLNEIKPLYRELKFIAEHRKADVKIFGADTGKFYSEAKTFAEREKFEREKLEVRDSIELPKAAKKLLCELKKEKDKLIAILKEYGSIFNAGIYDKEAYYSDEENDYSSAQLNKYLLHQARLGDITQRSSIENIKKPLPLQISSIIKKLTIKKPVRIEKLAKLIAYFKVGDCLREANEINSHNIKEQLFINSIQNALPQQQVNKIIEKLGNVEYVSIKDFAQILLECPKLLQSIANYPDIKHIQKETERINYLSDLILQTIINSLPNPAGKAFKLNKINDIKKNIHKLNLANKMAVKTMLNNKWPLYLK